MKKLLMLSWRDIRNPYAGGAEIFTHNILKRIKKREKVDITLWTGYFRGCKEFEIIDGIKIQRLGKGRFSFIRQYNWKLYISAFFKYWRERKQSTYNLVIEQINTIPFFTKFYVKEPKLLLIHQFCKENWFYQIPTPLSHIGYLLEKLYMRLIAGMSVLSVSESTKKDLLDHGFREENIHIVSEGIEIEPLKQLDPIDEMKYQEFTMLYLGAIRAMKRVDHVIRAFELAKKHIPELKLIIAGGGNGGYSKKVHQLIKKSEFRSSIDCQGFVSLDTKTELMKKSHVICMASVREGWGLTVTEANAMGTPAVSYSVPGLVCSVNDGVTGLLTKKNTPAALADGVIELYNDDGFYQRLRENAWKASKKVNWEQSTEDFMRGTEILLTKKQATKAPCLSSLTESRKLP